MNTTNNMQNRLSGVALILGGALGAFGQMFHAADPEPTAALLHYAQAGMPIHLLLYFAVMLILLGLPTLYARQSDKTGILGLNGFVLLFGIATIRARVYPSWPGWLLIAALVLNFVANFLPQVGGASYGGIALYLSLAAFAYELWSGQEAVTRQATAVAFK